MHLIKTQNLSLKTTFHMPERNTFFTYIYTNFFFNFQRYSPNTILLKTREKSILVENYHLSKIFA